MKLLKTIALQAVLAATTALTGTWATAQEFPTKPVRIIVPFPAGGFVDVFVRKLGDRLSQTWSQPVIVDNRPGASTIIAAETTARSAPDGYTLMFANDSTTSMNQYLFSKLPYDPVKDFAPVARMIGVVVVLSATNSVGAKDANDMVKIAKAKPDALNYGSFGLGTPAHVDAENFSKLFGVQIHHVPYKGVADILQAMLSDQVQLFFGAMTGPLESVRAGKLKALAVDLPSRSPLLPDVPTFKELGLGSFTSRGWLGLVAPAGTPPAITEKIANDVNQILNSPEFAGPNIVNTGLQTLFLGPRLFGEFLKEDRVYYERKFKELDVKMQ